MTPINIIVNGTKHRIDGSTVVALGIPSATFLSYNDVLTLAGFSAGRILTVTYRTPRIGDMQRTGVLTPGHTVLIEEGMAFTVADTGGA